MDNLKEFVAELASAFCLQAEAEALLEKIHYPQSPRPRWDSGSVFRYWAQVVAEIAKQSDGDLRLLAKAAREQYPANRIFLQAAGYERRLRIYDDQPITRPEQDAFGFLEYADVFSILINDQETATPLTLAVSGPSGSGKTSLAHLIDARLKVRLYWRQGWIKAPITCWVDTWQHGDARHLGAALAASVTHQVARQRRLIWKLISPLPSVLLSHEQRAWRRAWTWFVMASSTLLAFFVMLSISPALRRESGSIGQLYGHWHVITIYAALPALIAILRSSWKVRDALGTFIDSPRSAAAEGTRAEVHDQLGRVIRQAQRRWLVRSKRRVVIFIDDLERCETGKELEICEMVSHLLSHEDVVTVLVTDLDLLEAAASTRYQRPEYGQPMIHDAAEAGVQWLHKIIQFRFNLPALDRGAIASALTSVPKVDPSASTSRERTSNRLAAIQKWIDAHPAAPRIAALAAAVCTYFIITNIQAIVHGVSNPGSNHTVVGVLENLVAPFVRVVAASVTTVAWVVEFVVYSLRHPVILVGLASAGLVYQIASGAISRMWRRRRPRGAEAVAEMRRLEEYDSGEMDGTKVALHLPSNPRRAKQLVNHQRLYALVGEYRKILGGNPELTRFHLAKWVCIIERWPRLGSALTSCPAVITALEQAPDIPRLQEALNEAVFGITADNELLKVLKCWPPLSPVLARLVRFESSEQPGKQAGSEAAEEESGNSASGGDHASPSCVIEDLGIPGQRG